MSQPIADYDEPRRRFSRLLEPDCRRRILLWRGASGCGKTTLVNHCLDGLPEHMPYVPIQLRGAVSVAEIFSRIAGRLGAARVAGFARQLARLSGGPHVTIDHNWLVGIKNQINVYLQASSPAELEYRQAALADALFADLQGAGGLTLFAFDTYEQATTAAKEWIAGPFLYRAAQTPAVRVLVAGQAVPDPHNIEWQGQCLHLELTGVPQAEHWLPVVEGLRRRIPHSEPLGYLAGICALLQGDPARIFEVINTFPLREGAG